MPAVLKYALLGILLRAPMSGYDLERWIRRSIDHFWAAQLSQIYRSLRQLEEQGLVVSQIEPQESRPDRRVYTVTEAGRAEFDRWVDEIVTDRDPIRIPFLVRLFFSGQRDPADVLTQLRVMRDAYTRYAASFAGDTPSAIEEAEDAFQAGSLDLLVWDATRRAGELYIEFWIRWLDETIARLEHAG